MRAQIQQQFRPRDQITALYSFIANKLEIPQLVREDHLYFSACCVSQLYISQTPQGPEPGDPRRNIELHTNGDERPLLSINFECLRAFTYKIEMRQQQKRHCRTKNNYFFGVFSVKLFSFGRTQKHRKYIGVKLVHLLILIKYELASSSLGMRPERLQNPLLPLSRGEQEQDSRTLFNNWNSKEININWIYIF